jgi:hypothetical protein
MREGGKEGVQPREFTTTNGSGRAYDFNNEYRETNDNTERERTAF